MIHIATLKSEVEGFISKEIATVDNSYHASLRKFADWIERKQDRETAAIALLREAGYAIVAPADIKATAAAAVA